MTNNNQDELYRQARAVFDQRTSDTVSDFDFKIFQQLANKNYGKAYYPLSNLYRDMLDIESQNRAQHFAQLAFDWCFANQANPDVELWRDLGMMYWTVKENNKKAAYWFRRAAEQGDVEAQFGLGVLYLGLQDNEEGVVWLQLAANQGDITAQLLLADAYGSGAFGLREDYKESMKWYRMAAEQGNADAQNSLGKMYESGKGVPLDIKEAEKWYRLAADQEGGLTAD